MKKFIVLALILISQNCNANDFKGYWEGKYVMNGSGWPIRLNITQTKEVVSVYLDIPNFVYNQEPVEAKIFQNTIEILMPFGLNTLKFENINGVLIPEDYQISTQFKQSKPPPYKIQPISWNTGNVIIHGSLYLPSSNKKHPLLIRLHGSGTGTREHWEYRSWGDYFARKGIATVVFDRRGEGESEANSYDVSFNNLALDTVNLITKMKQRKDINSNKIILNGGSQAVYISLLTHSKSVDVDNMILSGAPSVNLIEQERQSLIFRMRQNNESEKSINQALGYQNLYFHYIRTGQNWEQLKVAAKKNQSQTWSKYTDHPTSESDLKWWRENFGIYQPELLIPPIKIPMLILYGENDVITPPSIMISNFKYHLKNTPNDSIKYVVCPDVGHSLEEKFRKDQWGNVIFPQRSKKMFDEIDKWLNKYDLASN
jgi:pimeloyl-ACP methyl ester carboxylesterase